MGEDFEVINMTPRTIKTAADITAEDRLKFLTEIDPNTNESRYRARQEALCEQPMYRTYDSVSDTVSLSYADAVEALDAAILEAEKLKAAKTVVSVEGGKYRFEHLNGTDFKCYRNGEPWRDLKGDKAVLALVNEVDRLRKS